MNNKHEFKVGDEVEVEVASDYDHIEGDFSVGDKFMIARFDCDGDALNDKDFYCPTKYLKLIKTGSIRKLWDGKEDLQVGVWVIVYNNERKVEMTDTASFCYYKNDGGIGVAPKVHAQPIDQRTDKEKLIDKYVEANLIVGLKGVLPEFYDEVIKHAK